MKRNGFTLIEILVVLAIIAILAALLFPAFRTAREKGHQATCASNLHQIYLAERLYYDDEKAHPSSLAFLLPNDSQLANSGAANTPVGVANTNGTGYLNSASKVLECPDDDTDVQQLRSSYGDVSTDMTKPTLWETANTPSLDLSRHVWNYYGYDTDGTAFPDPTTASTKANLSACSAATPCPLLVSPQRAYNPDLTDPRNNNPIKYSLSNRYAPVSTIITHCVYHRLPTSNLNKPDDLSTDPTNARGAIDIILRLDGSAQAKTVENFAAQTPSSWQLPNF